MDPTILQIALRYGPWVALMLTGGGWFKAHRSKSTAEKEHEKDLMASDRRFEELKKLYDEQRREDRERFEKVAEFYNRNVDLVDDYRGLVNAYKKLSEDQMTITIKTIEQLEKSNNIALHNLFCPLNRTEETITRTVGREIKA